MRILGGRRAPLGALSHVLAFLRFGAIREVASL
jgi:hypothetical protein